jgi:hypothetical protein
MNKEQQELLDEAYETYLKNWKPQPVIENELHWMEQELVNNRPLPKDMFIHCTKTDTEFSEKWGLKIVSRKLTNPERYKLWFSNNYQTGMEYNESSMPDFSDSYYEPTPTKLITITYNDTKLESYE